MFDGKRDVRPRFEAFTSLGQHERRIIRRGNVARRSNYIEGCSRSIACPRCNIKHPLARCQLSHMDEGRHELSHTEAKGLVKSTDTFAVGMFLPECPPVLHQFLDRASVRGLHCCRPGWDTRGRPSNLTARVPLRGSVHKGRVGLADPVVQVAVVQSGADAGGYAANVAFSTPVSNRGQLSWNRSNWGVCISLGTRRWRAPLPAATLRPASGAAFLTGLDPKPDI
jgi:hypothetical protein